MSKIVRYILKNSNSRQQLDFCCMSVDDYVAPVVRSKENACTLFDSLCILSCHQQMCYSQNFLFFFKNGKITLLLRNTNLPMSSALFQRCLAICGVNR